MGTCAGDAGAVDTLRRAARGQLIAGPAGPSCAALDGRPPTAIPQGLMSQNVFGDQAQIRNGVYTKLASTFEHRDASRARASVS